MSVDVESSGTHIKRCKLVAIGVESLVVKIDKLGGDGIDVGHGRRWASGRVIVQSKARIGQVTINIDRPYAQSQTQSVF